MFPPHIKRESTDPPCANFSQPQQRRPITHLHPDRYQNLRSPPTNPSELYSGHDVDRTAFHGSSDYGYGRGSPSVAPSIAPSHWSSDSGYHTRSPSVASILPEQSCTTETNPFQGYPAQIYSASHPLDQQSISYYGSDQRSPDIEVIRTAPVSSSKHKKERSFCTPPSSPSSPSEYPCLYPNCGHISSRAHNLKRHYTIHFPPAVEDLLNCKYESCGRTGAHGFKREEYRREHYRKVHLTGSEHKKRSGRRGGSTANTPVDPKNVPRSVLTEDADEMPVLDLKSMPCPTTPEPSGLMAETPKPLESQQPPKVNETPPSQETGSKVSVADANVETIAPRLDCPSKVFVGPTLQEDLYQRGNTGMDSYKPNERTPHSDDDSLLERSEGSILHDLEAPLKCEDRHVTGISFDEDQTMVATSSEYSIDYNLAILECGVLGAFQLREAGLHHAVLNIEWDILSFIKNQYRDNEYPNTALGSVITIIGSVQHAQATTCAEYVKQNWAAHGSKILEALQDALNSPKHTSECINDTSSADKSMSGDSALYSRYELEFDVSNDEVRVIIKSETLDFIVSAVSQLAWMGTALRTSANGHVQYCEPKLEAVLMTTVAEPVVFNVTFVISSPGDRDQSCWLPLFSNSVIARGFGIPEREDGEQGLEVPLEIMAALGGARHVSEYEGGLVLKGHSAMFVPISCQKSSVQWHLICASGEDRIPYREASVQCPNRALVGQLNHEKLSTTRTFLGWWKEAQTHLATADVDYGNIDWSNAKEAGSPPRLTGGTVGVSKILTAQVNFHLGAKDGSYHYSQQGPFQRTIDRAEKFPVVLYDQKDRRAWLVSALAVILHIIQLRNHIKPFVVGGNDVQISPLDPSRQRHAAREAVVRNKSLKLFDCETNEEKEYCFRDAVLDTVSFLDRLREKETTIQASPGMAVHTTWQNTLYGWELMDVAEEERHLKHKAQVLEKTAGRWYDLVKDVDAVVLFASGLGDIIRPRSESAELCRKWRSLPKEKDYLAVCVSMLENFYAKAGHRQDHQYLTSAKLQWHLGSMLFEPCADIASDDCQCDRLQQVYHDSHGVLGRRTTPGSLEANGCVVFGQAHHSFWGHKNVVRRQNAVHTLPNTSIQNGGTITRSRIRDDRLLSPPPADTLSPDPCEKSNHDIRQPKNPRSPRLLNDHLVNDETVVLKAKRKTSQTQLSESETSDDEASSFEDYAIYGTKYHPSFGHDRKSKKPRTTTTQTVPTPEDGFDIAHVRKCIPPESNIGRSGHRYGCSCTECPVVDFEPPCRTKLLGPKIETQHDSIKIAERRGRQRV